mgnify:CR=1 FL=1
MAALLYTRGIHTRFGGVPLPLPPADLAIILGYFAFVIALGFYVHRAAARGIESYFLGEHQTKWWMLAASGSSAYYDITGTMWIVSLFMLYGVKGMWEQCIWGFFYAAFFMTFMGKWIRRSGVLTGAEWMKTRFGSGAASESARAAYALLAVVTTIAFIAYGSVGIGKFGQSFMPGWSRNACALLLVAITSLYAIVGGFVSVVLIDLVHTVVLTAGVVILGAFAFLDASGSEAVQKLASSDWGSLVPPWKMTDPAAVAAGYEMFGVLVIFWVLKGTILEFGGPGQLYDFQRFLAARNSRDACKIGALWGVLHTFRWPLVAAIVVLAIAGVAGTADPEMVLPTVLLKRLPTGLRGITLAALLAAFMSTFDATINAGASYAVRDLYQRYLRPRASQRELVWASYVASAAVVIIGVVIGFGAQSIAQMFQWIMLALGGGVMVPCVLRWYWWRFNGWGFTAGTLSGILAALAQAQWFPKAPIWEYLPIVVGINVAASVAAALLTTPTDRETLKRFYKSVQPGGWWGPVARDVAAEDPAFRKESFARDLVNTLIAVPWIVSLYLFPIFLMFRRWTTMAWCLGVTVALSIVLYFTWYRHLPPAESEAGK